MVIFFFKWDLRQKNVMPGGVKKIFTPNSAHVRPQRPTFFSFFKPIFHLKPIFFGPKVFYTRGQLWILAFIWKKKSKFVANFGSQPSFAVGNFFGGGNYFGYIWLESEIRNPMIDFLAKTTFKKNFVLSSLIFRSVVLCRIRNPKSEKIRKSSKFTGLVWIFYLKLLIKKKPRKAKLYLRL